MLMRWFIHLVGLALCCMSVQCLAVEHRQEIEPSQSVRLDSEIHILRHAWLESASGARQVALPHILQPGDFPAEGGRVRYRLDLDIPDSAVDQLGIYIKKVSLWGRLYLNDQLIGHCALGEPESLRCLHQPWLVAAPVSMWKPGRNQVMVDVYADAKQMNGLTQIQVGPLLDLQQGDYAWQYFVRVHLMHALSWMTVILGALSLLVAFHLPDRSLYLWVGVASIFHAISNINFLATVAWPNTELFSWFAFSARMVSIPILLLAIVAFYEKTKRWHHWLAVSYAMVGPLLVWMSAGSRSLVALYYFPLFVFGALILIAILRWSWNSRQWSHGLMAFSFAVMLISGFGDWQRLRGASAFEGVYLLAYASAGFLAIMGSLVMAELASGLLKSRELALTLENKVAEREERLAQAYEHQVTAERTAAMTQERERLLADMHDSLGAGLSTAHLLLRQGSLSVSDAAYVVMECMDDLRLVFEVSANLDGRLEHLMADLRYRFESRLAGVGIKTSWHLDVKSAPTFKLANALQFMRIVQESLNNAIRHSGAKHLTVMAKWDPRERSLLLHVLDDGKGMPAEPPHTGQGLANMVRRAKSLGGVLDIRPAHPGTLVELWLRIPAD